MSLYQREFARRLFGEVLAEVARRRFILTADRWFADVDLLDLLDELGVSYVIRTKSSYKVRVDNEWRKLDSLRWRGNLNLPPFSRPLAKVGVVGNIDR
jgi:hypothetical protein